MAEPIQTVLVVGSGLMGRGIAESFVRGGHYVRILSRSPFSVGDLPEGVAVVGTLPPDPPDLVVEAIPEDLNLKVDLLRHLERVYPQLPIIGTNTSSLSLLVLSKELSARNRFLGLHYFYPANVIRGVEVASCGGTDRAVMDACCEALERNGNTPIRIEVPVAGFISNRLQHAMIHEALHMIENGYCRVEDIDNMCRLVLGPRMSVTGLILQKDISGLRGTAATQRELIPQLFHNPVPSQLLQDKARRGELGVATGRGFYEWAGKDVDALKQQWTRQLAQAVALASSADPTNPKPEDSTDDFQNRADC